MASEMARLKSFVSFAIVAVIFVIAQTGEAATYYVDRGIGNDSNVGTTETAPWRTIQRCLNVVVAGDTCNVKNGTYPEQLQMIGPGGTASAPITIQNFPGHTPVISFSFRTSGIGFYLSGKPFPNPISYVTFQGFEMTGAYGHTIKFDNGNHLIFRNLHIHHNSSNNDTTNPADGSNGILGRGFNVTIDRVMVNDIGLCPGETVCAGCECSGHGFYLQGSNYTLTNNVFYHNGFYGMQLACYAFNASNNATTDYSGFSNSLIAHNTLAYMPNRSGIVLWTANGGACSNNNFNNNIFYQNITTSGSGIPAGIYFYTGVSNITVNNNLFYDTLGETKCYNAITGTTGTNNVCNTANPNFVNGPATLPASPDFHLTANSTNAIDAGVTLPQVLVDYVGFNRPNGNGYDIGAYEFGDTTQASLTPPQNLQVR